MRNIMSVLAILVVLVAGCKDEKECGFGESADTFIFGHFYGECVGEGCVELFLIENGKLFEDTRDQYPGSETAYIGDWVELSAERYELVKDITTFFPEELFEEDNNVLGIPDGGDWGGIYVALTKHNQPSASGFWLLDQNENNMPDVYNDFVDIINEKIALIHQ